MEDKGEVITNCTQYQTYESCLAAVKLNGYNLQFVKEQSPEICLAAVQQNGLALILVKEQTLDICLAAVKQNSLALKDVKAEYYENCFNFINSEQDSLLYIPKPKPEFHDYRSDVPLIAHKWHDFKIQFAPRK